MEKIHTAAVALSLATPAFATDIPSELNFEPVATLSGKAVVRNGIEIKFGEVEIRLRGIEAPHDKHGKKVPGAEAAYDNLTGILGLNTDENTVCFLDGTRAEEKPVGVCFINWDSDGDDVAQDIAALQVEMGHALDCRKFSGGMYADAEKVAKASGQDLSSIYTLPAKCNET